MACYTGPIYSNMEAIDLLIFELELNCILSGCKCTEGFQIWTNLSMYLNSLSHTAKPLHGVSQSILEHIWPCLQRKRGRYIFVGCHIYDRSWKNRFYSFFTCEEIKQKNYFIPLKNTCVSARVYVFATSFVQSRSIRKTYIGINQKNIAFS